MISKCIKYRSLWNICTYIYNCRKRHNLYTCLSNVVCYFVYILLEYIFIYFNGHNLYTLYNVVMSFKVSRAAFMTRNQFVRRCNVFIILGKIAKLLNKNNSWTLFLIPPDKSRNENIQSSVFMLENRENINFWYKEADIEQARDLRSPTRGFTSSVGKRRRKKAGRERDEEIKRAREKKKRERARRELEDEEAEKEKDICARHTRK